MKKIGWSVLLVFVLGGHTAYAQNFFWSLSGFEEGAVNQNLAVDVNDDPTGTVFLYYESNGQDIRQGMALDFSWDNNRVVGFTAAASVEADILFDTGTELVDIGRDRWGDAFGPANEVTSDNVMGFLAKNVVGSDGILDSNRPGVLVGGNDFVDSMFDTTANAFFIGSFDYEQLGNGVASLQIDGLVVHQGEELGAPFLDVTFSSVPEPNSLAIVLLGLPFLYRRKR